jgi:hypothetical protein
MRRSTVLSLSLQLVFPAKVMFSIQILVEVYWLYSSPVNLYSSFRELVKKAGER